MKISTLSLTVKHALCFVLLATLSSGIVTSQSIEKQILSANKRSFSEELYTITDREIYIAGEPVLMKLFCLNRMSHNPSGMSKVAYVNLLDGSNNPLAQVKIMLDGFTGSGQIMLPDTIGTGNYFICSCTHWMQNFSPELFSYKKISVINPFQNIDRIRIPDRNPVPDTIIFSPEGGSIISGIETLVGFRCFDRDNYPVKVDGYVEDGNNNVLCNASSDKTGCGFFTVKPSGQADLFFVTGDDKYPPVRFRMPEVAENGISLSLKNSGEQRSFIFEILKSGSFISDKKDLYLIYEPVSLTSFKKEINTGTDNVISLDRSSLPQGLARVRILDRKGIQYAARWLYNEKKNTVTYSITTDKKNYPERGKVRIEISCTDPAGKPVESSMAISVSRSFSAPENAGRAGLSLQLPSLAVTLAGLFPEVINARLIFFDAGDNLLRGTNNDHENMYIPEPEGHVISGTIRNSITGKPVNGENVVLSFVGKNALCSFTKSNENGSFYFPTMEQGTREIVIQPLTPELTDYYIEIDNPFPTSFSKYHPGPFLIDTMKLEEINKAIIGYQLKNIYESSFTPGAVNENKIVSHDFYGDPDYSVLVEKYIDLNSVREIIKEIVPGAITKTRKDKSYITLVFKDQYQTFEMNPLVLVDGIPIFDHGKVLDIQPDDLESIEVLNSKYYVSSVVLNGIFDVTTNKGNLSLTDFEKPIFRQEFEALQKYLPFISPDYDTPSKKESRMPDFRNTLYWNPDVRTDKYGKAYIEFYTSDEAGVYTIFAEGFSADGDKGSSTAGFTVINE